MNAKTLKQLYEAGEISLEVYEHMLKSNRKARYFTYDLKTERKIMDSENVVVIPAREDSLERLLELGEEFGTEENVAEDYEEQELHERLHAALGTLTKGERRLIDEIFFSQNGNGKSEREAAKSLGIPQKTLNDRKIRIIAKIKKFLDL